MAVLGSFVSGQVLTAAELNAISTWTSFTPSWTGITAGTGSSNTGQYSLVNKTLYFRCKYVLGVGGSFTGSATLTLPASQTMSLAPQMLYYPSVTAICTDSGVTSYLAAANQATTTTFVFVAYGAAGTYTNLANVVNATVPFTWGVNDYIEIAGFVQVA